MIGNNQICEYLEQKLGIVLFEDYGEYERSYRQHNEVIAPLCGVFNMTPMTVTPISGLFLASATANIMIAADATNVSAVRALVDQMAATDNGETEYMTDADGKTYQITFSYSTAYVGVERTAPNNTGKLIPVQLTVYFSIIENGISSNDVKMQLDGEDVFFTELTVSQQRVTDAYSIAEGMATTAVLQKIRSFDFVVPILTSTIGGTFKEAVFGLDENNAHLLTINVGDAVYAYMVTFGNTSASVRAPQNVGANVSLVEGDPNTMHFSSDWSIIEGVQSTASVTVENGQKAFVFWGDGSHTIQDGYDVLTHQYVSSSDVYTVCVYTIASLARSIDIPSRSYVFYAEAGNMTASLFTSDYIRGTGGYWRRHSRVIWGDGSEDEYDTMLASIEDVPSGAFHTYTAAGEYTVTIYELDSPVWVDVEGA